MPERTPLYETASQSGAVFGEDFGWLMPAHYGNAAAEYHNARQHAVLFDISHHGKVEVSGADAASFLHNLCTNEVKNLSAGAGCEAFLTTGQAKIVAFVVISRSLRHDRSVLRAGRRPLAAFAGHRRCGRNAVGGEQLFRRP